MVPITITLQQQRMYGWDMQLAPGRSLADGGYDDMYVTVV